MYIHIHNTIDMKKFICSMELTALPRIGEFIVNGETVLKVKAIYHSKDFPIICEVEIIKISFSDIFND